MVFKISSIIKPEQVNLDMSGTKRMEAIEEVVGLLKEHENMINYEGFLEEIVARERAESTCLGNEVAFPHARTNYIKEMVIAAGVSKGGVLFENSNQMVKLIFVIGTPKRMVTEYLAVVGALARLLKEQSVRERLYGVEDAASFCEVLAEAER